MVHVSARLSLTFYIRLILVWVFSRTLSLINQYFFLVSFLLNLFLIVYIFIFLNIWLVFFSSFPLFLWCLFYQLIQGSLVLIRHPFFSFFIWVHTFLNIVFQGHFSSHHFIRLFFLPSLLLGFFLAAIFGHTKRWCCTLPRIHCLIFNCILIFLTLLPFIILNLLLISSSSNSPKMWSRKTGTAISSS